MMKIIIITILSWVSEMFIVIATMMIIMIPECVYYIKLLWTWKIEIEFSVYFNFFIRKLNFLCINLVQVKCQSNEYILTLKVIIHFIIIIFMMIIIIIIVNNLMHSHSILFNLNSIQIHTQTNSLKSFR